MSHGPVIATAIAAAQDRPGGLLVPSPPPSPRAPRHAQPHQHPQQPRRRGRRDGSHDASAEAAGKGAAARLAWWDRVRAHRTMFLAFVASVLLAIHVLGRKRVAEQLASAALGFLSAHLLGVLF